MINVTERDTIIDMDGTRYYLRFRQPLKGLEDVVNFGFPHGDPEFFKPPYVGKRLELISRVINHLMSLQQ